MLKIIKFVYMTDIERLRNLLGITQELFASKIGVSPRTVQNWEAGKKVPKSKLPVLSEIASKFPEETFTLFEVVRSPGAGIGNKLKGISSEDLKIILNEMDKQRKDYMSEINRKNSQIERLLSLLERK